MGGEQCEDTQAGRCGVTRVGLMKDGTGSVGAIGHTADNEGRTP